MKKSTQTPATSMFAPGEDLPLFSGTPIAVEGEHFAPAARVQTAQAVIPGFEEDRSWEALSEKQRKLKNRRKDMDEK